MSEGFDVHAARKADNHLTFLSLQNWSSIRCLLRVQGALYRPDIVEKKINNEKNKKHKPQFPAFFPTFFEAYA